MANPFEYNDVEKVINYACGSNKLCFYQDRESGTEDYQVVSYTQIGGSLSPIPCKFEPFCEFKLPKANIRPVQIVRHNFDFKKMAEAMGLHDEKTDPPSNDGPFRGAEFTKEHFESNAEELLERLKDRPQENHGLLRTSEDVGVPDKESK